MTDKQLIKILLRLAELERQNAEMKLKQVRDEWNKKYGLLEDKYEKLLACK